ncbi:MAG: hypothetical protein ACI8RN_002236 [Glaciecola sp.]|jgi:hypothetical protein|uniref:hypothetical protein n=1 Tax=Congregibacter sp. TaxID=2744308 RepID=UPI0039E3E38A
MFKLPHILLSLCCCLALATQAQDELRPYRLIDTLAGTLNESTDRTRSALESSTFEILGEYSPYPGATVIVITHPALLAAASAKAFGGYAAVLRVGLSEVDGKVQRSHANSAIGGRIAGRPPLTP